MQSVRHIRLFVNRPLVSESNLELSEKQSHYLTNVMRCRSQELLHCFNKDDGEFLCRIETADKKRTIIKVLENTCKPENEPNIWLLFSPLKKDKTDFVIEKAVELGVSRIVPVITHFTNSEKIKTERFYAQAVEASEQCGRLSVPEIAEAVPLEKLLASWDDNRILFFMDERRKGSAAIDEFLRQKSRPAAILIGPEGGFSENEAQKLNTCRFVKNLNLGTRILRAETAALAALSVWQAVSGDWNKAEM